MRVAVADVQMVVGTHFGISRRELLGHGRRRRVSVPRQIAISLCGEYTTASTTLIGKLFGGRDHTTVIHSCKRMERWGFEYSKDIACIRSRVLDIAAFRVAVLMCDAAWAEFEATPWPSV